MTRPAHPLTPSVSVTLLIAWVFSAMLTATALAASMPPAAPSLFKRGPTLPDQARSNLSTAEQAAFALMSAALTQIEAKILVTSCRVSTGTFDITVYADGTPNNPAFNFVVVDSPASTFTLSASLQTRDPFRGLRLTIRQAAAGAFDRVDLMGFRALSAFDASTNLMTTDSSTLARATSGRFSQFQGTSIRNFASSRDSKSRFPFISSWGLHAISKLGFPVGKYWQRQKAVRDNGTVGRTVLVQDRLVGPSACRIVADTRYQNNPDYFFQFGTLTISEDKPLRRAPELRFTAALKGR